MAADKVKADGTGVPGRGGAQLGEWAKRSRRNYRALSE